MQQLEPGRARRFADDDLRDVVRLRKADHVVGDAPVAARNGDGLAAQTPAPAAACRRCGRAPPRRVAGCAWSRRRAPSRGHAAGRRGAWCSARGPTARGIFAHADEKALACRPRPGDRPRLHLVEQLLVNALSRAAQRELAQRGQIRRREEMLECALGLLRHVDLALFQAAGSDRRA